jgi:site-specific DNA-methyltransferase (adenine-specific)
MTRREVIGDATLYLGDCMDLLPTLPKVDAVITDPPYGIGFAAQPTRYQRAGGRQAETWDDAAPQHIVDQLLHVAGTVVIWGGNYFHLPPTRMWLLWSKKNGYAPSFADFEMAWTNLDRNSKAYSMSPKAASLEKEGGAGLAHPNQKPVALMEWCMAQTVGRPCSILDPFMGSGTTGVAASNRKCQFIGIEREPRYFDIACRRIEQAYKQRPLFDAEPPKAPQQLGLEAA